MRGGADVPAVAGPTRADQDADLARRWAGRNPPASAEGPALAECGSVSPTLDHQARTLAGGARPPASRGIGASPSAIGTIPHRRLHRGDGLDACAEIGALDTRLSVQIAGVRTEIASLETRLIRWMVGTVLATGGLTFGILRFLG